MPIAIAFENAHGSTVAANPVIAARYWLMHHRQSPSMNEDLLVAQLRQTCIAWYARYPLVLDNGGTPMTNDSKLVATMMWLREHGDITELKLKPDATSVSDLRNNGLEYNPGSVSQPFHREIIRSVIVPQGSPEHETANHVYLRGEVELDEEQELDQRAKQTAINGFIARRRHSTRMNRLGLLRRGHTPPGEPKQYFCEECGMPTEALENTTLVYTPSTECSQCRGLNDCGWLEDAIETWRTV